MKKRFIAVFAVLLMTLPVVFGMSVTAQSSYEGYQEVSPELPKIYEQTSYESDYEDDYGYESDYDYYDYVESAESYDDSFEWGSSILIAVVVGLIAAGITTGVMYSQLKNVRLQTRAEDYVVAGSMNVTVARDLFLYQHTTRVAKPKKNK